jgi:hypothetical protein
MHDEKANGEKHSERDEHEAGRVDRWAQSTVRQGGTERNKTKWAPAKYIKKKKGTNSPVSQNILMPNSLLRPERTVGRCSRCSKASGRFYT